MRKAVLIGAVIATFALMVALTAYIDAFGLEPYWLKIERVTIANPGLSEALSGLRIVQLSDFHFRKPGGFLEGKILSALNKLKPDVIFITGDLVSRRLALRHFWKFVSSMKPAIWIYGIPGDSDEALINDKWLDDGWRRAGMSLLIDEIVPVVWSWPAEGKRIWMVAAGPDFNWANVIKRIPPGEPIIVLAHQPLTIKEAALAGADLVLAGDTHGTQMGIKALRRFSAYTQRGQYVSGLYKVKKTLLYVNRGTGWTARPMRFFCRPEITVFHFSPSGEMKNLRILPGDE